MNRPRIWLTVKQGENILSVALTRGELVDVRTGITNLLALDELLKDDREWYERLADKLTTILIQFDYLEKR